MLMPRSFSDEHDNYFKNYLTTGEKNIIGSAIKVRGERKNSELFPMRLSIAELPISDNGQRRFIGMFSDLQEVKNQENKLNQIQKMHTIGKLSGGIAHDYNNMLGVIMGYCELLEHKLHDQPELQKYANQIKLAGNREVELTKKILSYAKQQNGQRSEININELILGTEGMISSSLTASISLTFCLTKNIWSVSMDRYAFEDVLLNLCINAMHAMPTGGGFRNKYRKYISGSGSGIIARSR
jgi:signal transduction histidine kinase